MKKMNILFIVVSVIFSSQAALVNGGFNGGLAGKVSSLKSASFINRG